MEFVWANNCRSVFASSTPTSKETVNRYAEALGVGIRFVSVIFEALASHNEDTDTYDIYTMYNMLSG